jgi:hypothetical protein
MRYRRTITRHPHHKDLWLTRDGKAFVEVTPSRAPGPNTYPVLARFGYMHHLMIETFKCARPLGMIARHLDDDAQNWRADNLRWGTHADNARDHTLNGKRHRRKIQP